MGRTGVGSLGSHYGNQYRSSYNLSYIRCVHVVVIVAFCSILNASCPTLGLGLNCAWLAPLACLSHIVSYILLVHRCYKPASPCM